jgi:small ligand-binding sensory domain FIST
VAVSLGWRLLSAALPVDRSEGHALLRVGGKSAFESLMSAAAQDRDIDPSPGAADIGRLFCAVFLDERAGDTVGKPGAFADGAHHPVAIIGHSPDGSLTLAERAVPGQQLVWAVRLPRAAEDDMRLSVARLAAAAPDPAGGLVFSCIGRGPYFYDGEDHDLDRLRERYPGLPLLGTYGTGQIAANPAGGNRLLQNAVVTALISTLDRKADVQSKP